MRLTAAVAALSLATCLGAGPLRAATLPPHGPLKLLVISDEVNPHNLMPAEITQRGDISAALNAADSGLSLDGKASEVYSQCIDDALSALTGASPPHVIVYFAHQAAKGCDNSEKQTALTAAFQAHLTRGGGIVVFHHGGYAMGGKDAVLQLLGVSATGNIPWDTTVGQRVFNVAPGHFVTSNHVTYAGKAALAGSGDVPSGIFDYFDNIPDERYPGTMLLAQSGETRTILFASDSGGTRVLGYSLERAGWQGRVLFYQPAEYQPHALDDRAGPNFQVLANAIVYSVRQEGGGSGGSGAGGTSGGGASNAGAAGASAGSAGAAPSSTGGNANSGGSPSTSAGTSSGGNSSGGSGAVMAGSTSAGAPGSSDGGRNTAGGGAATPSAAPAADRGGCGFRIGRAGALGTVSSALALLALAFGVRRRARR